MLNELLIIERGARQAGIKMVLRHSEVKNAGRKPTLHVFLDDKGQVSRVQAIPLSRLRKQPLWKLGEGQKNSFPFVQPKPLWDDSAIRIWEDRFKKKSTDSEKRQTLLEIGSKARIRKRGDNRGFGNQGKYSRKPIASWKRTGANSVRGIPKGAGSPRKSRR